MVSTNNLVNSQELKLSKDNYESWSIQMKVLFGSQELWDLIIDGLQEPTPEVEATYTADDKKALREQKKKDSKVHFLLYQGLDESTFERVAEATTSKEAWEILATIYKWVERVKRIRLQSLRGDLEAAQMKDEEKNLQLLFTITSNCE